MTFQHRAAAARSVILRRYDRQGDRSQHENHGRDRRRLREQRRRTTRPECCLRTHSAERSGQIGRLAALEEDHDDQEETHDYVHDC